MESPTPDSTAAPVPSSEPLPPSTPASIYLALGLILLAVAAPYIGEYEATHGNGDSWRTLAVMLKWLCICAVAALGGIVSTIVGARRGGPYTRLTKVTIALCAVMPFTLLVIFSGGL